MIMHDTTIMLSSIKRYFFRRQASVARECHAQARWKTLLSFSISLYYVMLIDAKWILLSSSSSAHITRTAHVTRINPIPVVNNINGSRSFHCEWAWLKFANEGFFSPSVLRNLFFTWSYSGLVVKHWCIFFFSIRCKVTTVQEWEWPVSDCIVSTGSDQFDTDCWTVLTPKLRDRRML